MFKYEGEYCPYCNQPFSQDDDIAVCPECGTPHHRECYKVKGFCAHEAEHGAFEWQPTVHEEKAPIPEEAQPEAAACPRCGKPTVLGSAYCDYCGADLRIPPQPFSPMPGDMPVQGLPLENQIGDILYGVPVAEWKTYIGQNSYYYLFHMSRQEKTRRPTTATLSAMLFPGVYFLYRRVWGMAAVAFSLNVLFNIPAMVLTAQELGLGLWQPFGITAAMWQTANSVTTILSMAFAVACGLFAVALFRRAGVKNIERLHKKHPDQIEFDAQLVKHGGPCRTAVYIICGTVTLLALVSSMFGGAALLG